MIVQLYAPAEGDWLDIFVDGEKKFGGHQISPYALLQLLQECGADIDIPPMITWIETPHTERDIERLELGVSL